MWPQQVIWFKYNLKYFHLCLGHNTAPKTKLKDHVYRVGSASQASDYVRITKFIIAHIKEKYTKGGAEIAWALENEEDQDFTPLEPAMMVIVTPSNKDGTTLTYQEQMTQKQYEINYQQDLKTYTEKVEMYNNN